MDNYLSKYKNTFSLEHGNTHTTSKLEKLMIAIFMVVLPMTLSLILFLIVRFGNISPYGIDSIEKVNYYLVLFILPMIGIFVCIIFNKEFLKKTNFNIILMWVFLLPITYSLLLSLFSKYNNNKNITQSIYLITNILFFSYSIYLLIKNKSYKNILISKLNLNKSIILFLTVLIGLLLYFLLNYIFTSIQSTYTKTVSDNQTSIDFNSRDPLSVARVFILAVLFAPIIEEIIYRYIMQNIFENKSYSIFLSTLLFAFVHINNSYDWSHFLSYVSLGIINGVIYYYFNNITPTILIHFLVNMISFILLF